MLFKEEEICMNNLLVERNGKLNECFISGRQKLRWPTPRPLFLASCEIFW